MSTIKNKPHVPIREKFMLDYHEASAYFGIGINRLREILNEPGCSCTVQVGEHRKQMIIRSKFEEYLSNHSFV